MSFTDQKQRIVTEADLKASWGGEPNGKRFGCYLCGKKFSIGDKWRWVSTTHKRLINCIVCDSCDGPDVIERWVMHYADFKKRFWAFTDEGYPEPAPPSAQPDKGE